MANSVICVPGCRWIGQVVTFGPDIYGDVYAPGCGASLLRLLPFVPVGYFRRPDGQLGHRAGGLIQPLPGGGLDGVEHLAGIVERAWLTGDGVDVAFHLADETDEIRRVLLGLERRGRLWGSVGLSLYAHGDRVERRRDGSRLILSIDRVDSIDFATPPAGRKCYVRRRLPCLASVTGIPVTEKATVAG